MARETIPREQETVQDKIRKYALKYGADVNLALLIAKCESGFSPTIKNKNSTATGVYQIIAGTGKAWGVKDRTDPDQNIEAAMIRIARGETSHWDSSKSCWIK